MTSANLQITISALCRHYTHPQQGINALDRKLWPRIDRSNKPLSESRCLSLEGMPYLAGYTPD